MTTRLTFQEMYDGMVRKDSTLEGLFVAAVRTTGIFCRPVCPARKPKPENVEFFDTPAMAILHGYRPCRVCKPMEQAEKTPQFIQGVIDEISANPGLRLKDADLRKRNIEPNKVRRWFKKTHNMSFHAFQRMIRINSAFQKINSGEAVTASAFDSGYNSLSGFNESFRTLVGASPTASKTKLVINISRFTTPLGPMFACATPHAVCLMEFVDRKMLETELNDLKKKLNAVVLPGDTPLLRQVQAEMNEYFEGKRKQFTVPLNLPGTAFQQTVWEALQQVPYGETCSYKQLAYKINNPKSVRAVAAANGYNRVAIIVPCHRVIGENGALTGYGGGLERKVWLIEFEKKMKWASR
jgi:AraC family transcriptional regulator, regulatory protein of adaptative response / methylated-DNA-[protein]-cysteine methyltransferase